MDAHQAAILAVKSNKLGSRNVTISGRRTSFRLDDLTWKALQDVAAKEGLTVHQLCSMIDVVRPEDLSLTVAVRCYLMKYGWEK